MILFILSTDVCFLEVNVKSIRETFGVGTLIAVPSSLSFKLNGNKEKRALPVKAGHTEALNAISEVIASTGVQPIAIGHRVVHGGEKFKQAALVDESVLKAIEDYASMAPLHNMANLKGIITAQEAYPDLPHVAVFDTSFFQTLPKKAFIYALPMSLYREHGIRRYGFHGTSHKFILDSMAKILEKPVSQTSIISAHLGNGCSVSAIEKGQAVDTSLGFIPLEGLVMGTRCGDLDPSLPGTLQKKLGKTVDEISDLLNKQSGLLGISELSNDCRTLEDAAGEGHEGALLAIEIFCYRLAKYIAGYMVSVPTLDAIVYLNTTLPPSLKMRGAVALVKSEELVAGEWMPGRRLFGIVTKLNDSQQVSNILSRGRNLEACKQEIDRFLAATD